MCGCQCGEQNDDGIDFGCDSVLDLRNQFVWIVFGIGQVDFLGFVDVYVFYLGLYVVLGVLVGLG